MARQYDPIFVLGHLKCALDATGTELFFLLGPVCLLAFAMHCVSRALCRQFGHRVTAYLTGWLGTPVHEIGHAAAGILFGFRILEMKLWRPAARDGILGYVRMAPPGVGDPRRAVGPFFIGTGPLLFGATLISLAAHYLLNAEFVPIGRTHRLAESNLAWQYIADTLWRETYDASVEVLSSTFTKQAYQAA